MKKDCSPLAFNLIETLINLSPSHKNIAVQFYFWFRAWQKGTMPLGLQMGIKYIAENSDCSYDTVCRFFSKYPYLVKRHRRAYRTNRYELAETFLHAMQFMDAHGILEKNTKQQKNWYKMLLKKELEFVYGNVGICDPPCRYLRPNPLLIPGTYVNLTGKGITGICSPTYKREKEAPERILTIPKYIDRLDLPLEIKLKLSLVSEGTFQSALESAKYKHRNGWHIRNHSEYVVGSALKMAKKQGMYIDWPAYYSTIKKHTYLKSPK